MSDIRKGDMVRVMNGQIIRDLGTQYGPTTAPGLCELQASPFCEGMAVMVRLDPMAMAPEDPAPASTIPTCQECFDHRSDQYLRSVAR